MLMDALPKDCEWLIGGDFNMTKRPGDKSYDCGRPISGLERGTWQTLLQSLQINDYFIYQGGPRYYWNNGQREERRRLPRLDKVYTPTHSRLNIHLLHIQIFRGLGSFPVALTITRWGIEMRRTTSK